MEQWQTVYPTISGNLLTPSGCFCCSIYVWDIRNVLGDAGLVPDTNPDGNHCSKLETHECTLNAVALSSCDTMMASADASGKLVIRFSSCL